MTAGRGGEYTGSDRETLWASPGIQRSGAIAGAPVVDASKRWSTRAFADVASVLSPFPYGNAVRSMRSLQMENHPLVKSLIIRWGDMEDRKERDRNGAPSSERTLIDQLYERIARLHATVQELRNAREELKADQQRLLEENRSLRRKLTLSNLIEELESSVGTVSETEVDVDPTAPLPANELYQQLPSRLSFPLFFQIAKDEQIETDTARRCLVHYLHEGLFVQSGAYLEKTTDAS